MTHTYTEQLHARLEQGASKLDATYAVIRRMIQDGELGAGQLVSERALSAALGVSRTPVRAALNRLAYDGYVDIKADVCTVVAELGIGDILELFEIREALECKAAELFCLRKTAEEAQGLVDCFEAHRRAVAAGNTERARELDNELHLRIARGSKNRRLHDALANYIALSMRSMAIGSSYEYRYDRSLPQHSAIVQALVQSDAPAATAAVRAHMADIRDFFKRKFLAEP